jgi:hypothetical protein
LYDNILNKLHLKLLFSVFSYVLFVQLYPQNFLIFPFITWIFSIYVKVAMIVK